MKWLCVAVLLVVTATGQGITSIQNQSSGTCASVGYSTTCCPPGGNCQATDGDCHCSTDCHMYGDCCTDVHCTAEPRTCADVGITTCCNDETDAGNCEVHFNDNNLCSCNISCHTRNDCCPDVRTIGCIPRTCTEAGKDPGCCMWSQFYSCFVRGDTARGCYCDQYCTLFNDCCKDVTMTATSECDDALRSRTRIQSHLERALKGSTIQTYNTERQHRTRVQNTNTNSAYFRDALSARIPRPRARANQRPAQRTRPTRPVY